MFNYDFKSKMDVLNYLTLNEKELNNSYEKYLKDKNSALINDIQYKKYIDIEKDLKSLLEENQELIDRVSKDIEYQKTIEERLSKEASNILLPFDFDFKIGTKKEKISIDKIPSTDTEKIKIDTEKIEKICKDLDKQSNLLEEKIDNLLKIVKQKEEISNYIKNINQVSTSIRDFERFGNHIVTEYKKYEESLSINKGDYNE